MTKTIIAALTTASFLAMTGPAFAQHASAGSSTEPATTTPQEGSVNSTAQPDQAALGDIIVTAQRRQERVTDVPISITVVGQSQLEREQINTFNDLARIAPSLEIQQAPGQNTGGGGSIRGIGTQTFSAGAVASVGVVVDQVSQGNANISNLFDVARIEVLKGPQGTLFGLTTSAGVINITTNAPDPTQVSGRIRTELSGNDIAGSKFGNQIVQGVVNVPLSENAAIRVAGFTNLRQGPGRDVTTGHFDDTNQYGGRARLLWTPTDRLTINLIGDYSYSTIQNGGDFFTFLRTDPGTAATLAGCGVVAGYGNRSYCTTAQDRTRSYNYGGSLQVDYDAGPFTLTSISSVRENKSRGPGSSGNIFRADPLPLQIQNPLGNDDLGLVTQELRVASRASQSIDYTFGVFFSRQIEDRGPQLTNVTLYPAPGVVIPIERSLGAYDRIKDESLAAYGQGTIHLTDAFRFIAGGRVTSERLALNRVSLDTPASPYYNDSLSVENFSWRLGAQYDLPHNTMAYATVSHGYKAGQIATPVLPLVPYLVQPEIPTDFELGLKSTLFGGLVADLNLFYDKIHNFQSQQCTTNPATAAISCVQTNIDGVRSRGAEINLFGRVAQGLSVNTGFIWAKATYPGNYTGTDGTNIGGQQLAYAPEYKFTVSGEYEHLVAEHYKAFFSPDAIWKSRVRYEANSIGASTFGPHWMVGGRLGVRTENDRYELAVFGRNLFNVHEPELIQSGFPFGGAANLGVIYGQQSFRQLGLQLDAKF